MNSKLDYGYTFLKQNRPEQVLPKGTKKDPCWRASCISAVPRQGPEKDPRNGPQIYTKMMTVFDSKMKVLGNPSRTVALDAWGSRPAAWP